jgi:hypothetical protein
MNSAAEQLALLGYGRMRSEPACWRVVRLDPPAAVPAWASRAAPMSEPARSRALLRWRDILAREQPRPSPYRIARADG